MRTRTNIRAASARQSSSTARWWWRTPPTRARFPARCCGAHATARFPDARSAGHPLPPDRHRGFGLGSPADADPADLVDPQGERSKAAEQAVDRLRAKFGRDAVVKGLALDDE